MKFFWNVEWLNYRGWFDFLSNIILVIIAVDVVVITLDWVAKDIMKLIGQ